MSIVLLNNYSQVSLHLVFLKSVIRNSQFNTIQIELGWVSSGLANFKLNKNNNRFFEVGWDTHLQHRIYFSP